MMSAMVSWNGMGEVCSRWYESVDPIDDDFVQQATSQLLLSPYSEV
jgi:hypothetical protein